MTISSSAGGPQFMASHSNTTPDHLVLFVFFALRTQHCLLLLDVIYVIGLPVGDTASQFTQTGEFAGLLAHCVIGLGFLDCITWSGSVELRFCRNASKRPVVVIEAGDFLLPDIF